MELDTIIQVVLSLISFVAIVGNVKLRKAIKESKEAYEEIENALEDGKLTKEEIAKIMIELEQALKAINSLWQAIKVWDWSKVKQIKNVKEKAKK